MAGKRVKIKAQSVSEYSLFLAIVLIAIIAMNAYIKRGLQGRYKDVADLPMKAIASQVASAKTAKSIPASYVAPTQYEPSYADTKNEVNIPQRKIYQTVANDGKITQDFLSERPTVVTGKNIEGTDATKD